MIQKLRAKLSATGMDQWSNVYELVIIHCRLINCFHNRKTLPFVSFKPIHVASCWPPCVFCQLLDGPVPVATPCKCSICHAKSSDSRHEKSLVKGPWDESHLNCGAQGLVGCTEHQICSCRPMLGYSSLGCSWFMGMHLILDTLWHIVAHCGTLAYSLKPCRFEKYV